MKRVMGIFIIAFVLVSLSFVCAETYSSTATTSFSFGDSSGSYSDLWDAIIFIGGVALIIFVLIIIIRKWRERANSVKARISTKKTAKRKVKKTRKK